MILILTAVNDVTADLMEVELDRREARYVRIDPAEASGAAGTSAYFGPAGIRRCLGTPAGSVSLDAVTAVWWRRPSAIGFPEAVAGSPAAATVGTEISVAIMDLLDSLDSSGVQMVPAPYLVTDRAQGKLRQLRIAGELGFEVPSTLATDDPDELLDFATRHDRLVTKRASPGMPIITPDGVRTLRYTDVLRPVDLLHADAVALCPVIVQAYVPKRAELRVTVVGDRVFAASIDSQGTHHTRDDWRHYDNDHTVLRRYDLPDDVAGRCVALTRVLGLCYGAIDLVVTPDGRYVFLEINPNGQYQWIEARAGLPITAAIADLLTGAAVPWLMTIPFMEVPA